MPTSSHLHDEIFEQPQVLRTVLVEEDGRARRLADAIQRRGVSHVVIAARGTSDNAGRYAQYLLGTMNGLYVGLATPSLTTVYGKTPQFRNALVIGISQSGKSPDIVGVLSEARSQGCLTAAITNDADSDLAREVEHVLLLHAGVERSIAATKTYTSELMALALLASALRNDGAMFRALEEVPDAVSEILDVSDDVAMRAERYRYMTDCVVIGRGYNYASAFELALKLKELTYTIAEPYSSADFMHGPLALIEHGFPAILIAPSGKMLAEMGAFLNILKDREAETIVISDDMEMLQRSQVAVRLNRTLPEWLSPVSAIVPGQLLALYLAAARGYDPDHPRGLRKVTETR
jgi:glucosamine--fructose-6-phosphate aminotransferase (isomerizing)